MEQNNIPTLSDIDDVCGKRVLVRASLNAPTERGVVRNKFRITQALLTLKQLSNSGAKVIVIAHIGRDPKLSLLPVFNVLKENLPISFCKKVVGEEVRKAVSELATGEILLLENLRSEISETENITAFAQELSSYADIFVNDAFAVSHRKHASIVGIPQYVPGYVGNTFEAELNALKGAMNPQSPSVFILGGAKFETKLPLIEKYRKKYDYVFVGGALANDFYKAKGYEVGNSLVSNFNLKGSTLLTDEKILLPVDVVVQSKHGTRITTPDTVRVGESILDAGPDTVAMLARYSNTAEMILWNGPLGNYENGFGDQTRALAQVIASSNSYSVVGGGDTIAVIEELALFDQFNFVSTAGGAMLAFLEFGNLPGIDAILNSHKL